MTQFRPFRACLPKTMEAITKFPMLVSPKIDGIRALTPAKEYGLASLMSKSLKPIPNRHIVEQLVPFTHLDGEVVIGQHFGPGVYDRAKSEVMTIKGEPDFYYWVFDTTFQPNRPYIDRFNAIRWLVGQHPRIKVVPQYLVNNFAEMIDACETLLEAGFEGGMVRDPDGVYKHGQATAKEQNMFKFKPYADADAIILDFVELTRNENEPTIDARGLQVRGTSQENKVPAGTLGAFLCKSDEFSETFTVGAGPLGAMQSQSVWDNREKYRGLAFKFKYQQYGSGTDRPRQPSFLTWRPAGA